MSGSGVTDKTIFKTSFYVFFAKRNAFAWKNDFSLNSFRPICSASSPLSHRHSQVHLLSVVPEKIAGQCPSTFFCQKMSVYILPYNVNLKGKNKPYAAKNVPPYTTFYPLSSIKVSRRLDLLFSSYGQNKCQNVRLQSVWKRLFCKKKRFFSPERTPSL